MTTPEPLDWKLFRGTGQANGDITRLPPPPPWREFRDDEAGALQRQREKGVTFQARPEAIEMVNAALYLRRPLLITGNPGTGKSSLAYAVAYELKLGPVLKWPITTRTTLKDGLYGYDAIARLQDAQANEQENREQIGEYITLGPLGTAFLASDQPRVLLIDEIDKSDIDLPNDLLNLFEDGEFAIPELQRFSMSEVEVNTSERDESDQQIKVRVRKGIVRCRAFPLVIMTSNNERDFPPPFLRRCLRLNMPDPTPEELGEIIAAHLGEETAKAAANLITDFENLRKKGTLATDQLLNAIYLLVRELPPTEDEKKRLKERLLRSLSST